jgi:hypothetical protein
MTPRQPATDPGPHTVMGEHLEAAAPQRARRSRSATARRSDALGWLLFGGLLLGVWQISQMQLYSAKSDTGYWLGVVGGVLMLLLFAYPLRKRWPVLARMGKAKHWFVVHMVLGIGGPLMILAHCTFRIGSVNAGVALGSMVVVALSGVAGRFIYLRIHRGLGGETETFGALRQTLGFDAEAVHTQLHFAPQVEARLRALDRHAGRPGDSLQEHLHRLFVLPVLLWRERRWCQREATRALAALAPARGWDAATLATRTRRARRLVASYTGAVQRVAQLAAYTRLFSLWHVLHVPFVFVMVVCAIAHVVAVHAY